MKNFSQRGPLQSPRIAALEARYQEPIGDLLRHLYYDQRLTLTQISERLEVPLGTLGRWMIRLGINQRALAERAAHETSA